MRPPTPLLVLLLVLVLAGCTSSAPPTNIARSQLAFPVVSSLGGVNASSTGSIGLVAANGLRVDADAASSTLRIGVGPTLQVDGAVIACGPACNLTQAKTGMVVADGSLISHNDLSLNANGPDRDSVVYFYDKGQQNGEYFRWWKAADRFELSHNEQVDGELLVDGGPVGTVTPANLTNGSFVFTSALEGNDVAIYLRGSATMDNGTARIDFPAPFAALVGDGPITAQVTLTSKGPALWVSEKAKDHITVETTSDANGPVTFDYFIQAPRVGAASFHTVR
jgi:hypothetical protein